MVSGWGTAGRGLKSWLATCQFTVWTHVLNGGPMCFVLYLANVKDPSALPKLGCLALPSLLSSLLWHYSRANHLHLSMVGGALSHLETLRLQYTLYLSIIHYYFILF